MCAWRRNGNRRTDVRCGYRRARFVPESATRSRCSLLTCSVTLLTCSITEAAHLLISHFSPLTFHFSLFTSEFSECHFSLLTSHFSLLASHCNVTSHFSTAHLLTEIITYSITCSWQLLTSHFSLLPPHFSSAHVYLLNWSPAHALLTISLHLSLTQSLSLSLSRLFSIVHFLSLFLSLSDSLSTLVLEYISPGRYAVTPTVKPGSKSASGSHWSLLITVTISVLTSHFTPAHIIALLTSYLFTCSLLTPTGALLTCSSAHFSRAPFLHPYCSLLTWHLFTSHLLTSHFAPVHFAPLTRLLTCLRSQAPFLLQLWSCKVSMIA